MPHAPFIIAAYAIALVLLAWCALAPVMQGRKLKKTILQRIQLLEEDHASDS